MADREDRKAALMRAARERLTHEDPAAPKAPARDVSDTGGVGAGREVMYRGKKVRMGNAGTPGGGVGRAPARGGGGSNDVRAALEKLNNLYREGLISKAEAEAKRAEILDRL